MTKRYNFSFAGPRKLEEILKTELVQNKSRDEVTALWQAYHEEKKNTFGWALDDKVGRVVLDRAKQCPFFVHPVFREGGFFTLVSQFQDPGHFFLAWLEDYKKDPHQARPLATVSVFSELSDYDDDSQQQQQQQQQGGVHLVRGEVVNRGLNDIEGRRVMETMLSGYEKDEEFEIIRRFNEQPDAFDFDDYMAYQNQKWKDEEAAVSSSSPPPPPQQQEQQQQQQEDK